MYLALPGVIAFALFELQGDQVSMMDEAYPQLVAQVVPAPLMGFFAAVMLGAILSSFNSVLNSVDTMFTMDIYAEFIDQNASEEKTGQGRQERRHHLRGADHHRWPADLLFSRPVSRPSSIRSSC